MSRPRKAAGGPALAREHVVADQRLRLLLAMIDAVEQKGYRATTVADVVVRAELARKTFYEHFANKQECFLVTFDLVAREALRRVERAYREADGAPKRAQMAILAVFEVAIENPGALRLSVVELPTVGAVGIERRERWLQEFASFIGNALELRPGEGPASESVLKAVMGGIYGLLYRRVLSGERAELLALVPDLVSWATSYSPTPAAIVAASSRGSEKNERRRHALLDGGRAPGTLAPHGPLSNRRGLPRGDQNVSRSFVVHNQRERILDAVANLTAAGGYAALTVEDIAEQAAVSHNAFYEHFGDKEDAFLVAYELGHSKALATVERAYTSQSDWRLAVRSGISTLLEFLACEPSFAHLALVDALTASSRTAERSHAGVAAFAQMLVPGLVGTPGHRSVPVVTIEAVAGGIFELCLQYALQRRIAELPELTVTATYFALAPFIGVEEAARVATEAMES